MGCKRTARGSHEWPDLFPSSAWLIHILEPSSLHLLTMLCICTMPSQRRLAARLLVQRHHRGPNAANINTDRLSFNTIG